MFAGIIRDIAIDATRLDREVRGAGQVRLRRSPGRDCQPGKSVTLREEGEEESWGSYLAGFDSSSGSPPSPPPPKRIKSSAMSVEPLMYAHGGAPSRNERKQGVALFDPGPQLSFSWDSVDPVWIK